MAAIYQWFQIYEEEYTTTLYPLETQDAILMSVDLGDDWYIAEMESDAMIHSHELVAIDVRVLLLSAPEQSDSMIHGHELVDIVVRQLLLSAPEQNDAMIHSHELVDLVVNTVLITTYEPDQGLLMSVDLVPGSMYLVTA